MQFISELFREKCYTIIAKADVESRNILQGTKGFKEGMQFAKTFSFKA